MNEQIDERAIFIRGPVVIFKWRNTEGWPVEYVSPNAAEVFGFTPEQFLSGEVAYGALVDADDIERVSGEVARAVDSGDASFVHAPYRVHHSDGSIRWLHDVTRVVRADSGEATHFIGYVVDITERVTAEQSRRALEEKLLQSQKLESLGILAGGVAHDFNNLLTGILGEASLAEMHVGADQTELTRSLEVIQALAQRAAGLTQQLLAYTGRGQFVVVPVDLSAVVENSLTMLESVISKKASLETELNTVPAVLADLTQLQQIIMNLVTNASDSLEGGSGTICITVSSPDPGHVELMISDTGCGMTDSVKSQIFDPFFTTKHEGRGLGMSAVQGIVRGHEAQLEFESAVGTGTTFVVRFDAAAEEVQHTSVDQVRSEGWSGDGLVLVVDDEPSIRAVAEKMFEHLGFDVLSAEDGQAGIDVFAAHRDTICLVLLDLMMPNVDGLEAMSAIRNLEPDVPIILSSGYSSFQGLGRIERPDITNFFQKPYRFDEFEQVVQNLLKERCSRRAKEDRTCSS